MEGEILGMRRNRIIYGVLVLGVMVLGLLTRRIWFTLPSWVNMFLGDALWALMIFLGFGFVFIKISTIKIGLLALGFCYLIEISQLYQGQWLNNIRMTTLGGLILGYGFLLSDIFAYTLGVSFGVLGEYITTLNKKINI